MSKELPRISGREAKEAFCRAGFVCVRITGSHFILKKEGCRHLLSVPIHAGQDMGVGLLKKQIKQAGLTLAQFLELLS